MMNSNNNNEYNNEKLNILKKELVGKCFMMQGGEAYPGYTEMCDGQIPTKVADVLLIEGELVLKTRDDCSIRDYLWWDPELKMFIEGYKGGPTYEHVRRSKEIQKKIEGLREMNSSTVKPPCVKDNIPEWTDGWGNKVTKETGNVMFIIADWIECQGLVDTANDIEGRKWKTLATQITNELKKGKTRIARSLTNLLKEFTTTEEEEEMKKEKEALRKKAKKFKDPNCPKKARNAFIFFCRDERSKVTAEELNTHGHIMKCLGNRYTELKYSNKDEDKKRFEGYQMEVAKDKERYETERRNYIDNILLKKIALGKSWEE